VEDSDSDSELLSSVGGVGNYISGCLWNW